MRLALYCQCGAEMDMDVLPRQKLADVWPEIAAIWDSEHSGEGHDETDQKTCRRNRSRNERSESGTS